MKLSNIFKLGLLAGFVGLLLSQTQEEVEVTAKAELKIEDAVKPITDVTLAPFEPVDSLLYKKEKKLEVRLPKTIEDEIRKVIKLEDKFLRQPVFPKSIYKEIPLALDQYNRKYKGIKSWKLEIFDSWGKKLRTFTGKGKLPKYIYWDGRDEQGRIVVSPGELYQFRITVNYVKGRRTELSKPFTVKGFYYEEGGYKHIALDISDVFERGFAVFKEGKEERIIEALNILKENFPWQGPIEMTYYPDRKGMMVMEARLNTLRSFILSRLPVEEGNLVLKPGYYSGGGIKVERLHIKFK